MRRRLDRLEARATPVLARDEEEVVAETCRRLATDELLAMDEAFERLNLEDEARVEFPWEELTERERRAFERYEEARSEVRAGQ